jgi:hypothetical protein
LITLVGLGCGDDASHVDALYIAPCDYTELTDATNDTMAEATGLSAGTVATQVCGQFDPGHFTATTQSADDDLYGVTVTVATPLLIDVFGGPGVETLTGVTVRFFDTSPHPVLLAEAKPTLADHGAFLVTVPAGNYNMMVSADATAQVAVAIPYRVRLSPMPPCDAGLGSGSGSASAVYAEANDVNGANDTVAVDFTKDPSFTPIASSMPEVTNLTIEPSKFVSISGAIDATPRSDQYLDRDTYEITTGMLENQLAVRLDWDGAASDLDYIVFDALTMTPIVASNLTSNTGPELQMFAVVPATKYWLWIGGFQGSAATTYHANVCGSRWFY